MHGIDLNKPLTYLEASFRFFGENEYHITRHCSCDVLILVFDGVLRFSEDGVSYEVHPGQYHIQKKGSYQTGGIASDAPKYMFIHFLAEWMEKEPILPYRGAFDYAALKSVMETLDELAHNESTLTEKLAKCYEVLSLLYHKPQKRTVANEMADFITQEYKNDLSLELLSKRFHFSRNHIINLFKAEYGMTPFEYINDLKLKKAERLLEVTSNPVKNIAYECGFHDYAYFYKLFCRKHELSPTEWRSQKRS